MKLKSLPQNVNLLYRLVDENEIIEMGVFPVMYGLRLRAGYYDYPVCELDWCCGANMKFLNDMYFSLALHLLSIPVSKYNPYNIFRSLPSISRIKPAHKDEYFMKEIEEKIGFKPIVKMNLDNDVLKSIYPIIL